MDFKIGDHVCVIAKEPVFSWGSVSPEDIGEIICCPSKGSDIYRVRFPGKHSNWSCRGYELELVDPDLAEKRQYIQNQPIL